jgi:hypothetical protein
MSLLPIPQPPKPLKPFVPATTPGLAGGANKFATGNKSYGAGQIGAATSGVLAKTGYLERARNKQMRQLAIKNAMQSGNGTSNLGSAL